MRLYEILAEADNAANFSQKMIHETTPAAAQQIQKAGFKDSYTGIFFNVDDAGYSGGGYGGAHVICLITGNSLGILDLEDDVPDDLDEFADGEEIATYAHRHKYWAWTDGMQFAVLDRSHIKILGIE